jgi:RHS repeat-associated protein
VLTQERVGQRFFAIVTDLVGTPTELVDPSTETIAWRSVATLWGQTSWPRDSTTYTPLRFPGQYFDPETRLHYNVHRFYDPETARYFSQDPLGLLPAPNPAAYVRNPCTWVDPFGLSPHPRGPLYSEIQHGQRGPAYAEVTPQTLADAQAGIIGSEPGRGARWAPDGFVANSGHSRGHLIGRQFGGDGRDMRNIITQGATQNNGPISDAEGIIANHVASTGNPVIMSVTPIYGNGGVLATQVRLEAVDDFGWSFDQTLANF